MDRETLIHIPGWMHIDVPCLPKNRCTIRTLIITRPGNMDTHDMLSAEGHQQMDSLAERLAPYLHGTKARFLGSPVHVAVESANSLLAALKQREASIDKIVPFDELYAVDRIPQNFALVIEKILKESADVDVIIVMTHGRTGYLPFEYGRQVLRARIEPYELAPGQACIIHCEAKTTTIVR